MTQDMILIDLKTGYVYSKGDQLVSFRGTNATFLYCTNYREGLPGKIYVEEENQYGSYKIEFNASVFGCQVQLKKQLPFQTITLLTTKLRTANWKERSCLQWCRKLKDLLTVDPYKQKMSIKTAIHTWIAEEHKERAAAAYADAYADAHTPAADVAADAYTIAAANADAAYETMITTIKELLA